MVGSRERERERVKMRKRKMRVRQSLEISLFNIVSQKKESHVNLNFDWTHWKRFKINDDIQAVLIK